MYDDLTNAQAELAAELDDNYSGPPTVSDFLPAMYGKLPCSTCGMVANVDPDFHRERYDHIPTIRNSAGTYAWDGDAFCLRPAA
jgi:hypothetical protein